MTDRDDTRTDQQDRASEAFVVPGAVEDRDLESLSDEELVDELQRAQDLGSASRSCVAIIAVLLIVALLLCIFLVWAFFIRG